MASIRFRNPLPVGERHGFRFAEFHAITLKGLALTASSVSSPLSPVFSAAGGCRVEPAH